MLKIKDGVDLSGVRSEMFFAATVIDQVYEDHGVKYCFITSAKDGKHGFGSLHYVGLALDFRVRNVPEEVRESIHKEIVKRLGKQYDVLLKSTHIHAEFQPK